MVVITFEQPLLDRPLAPLARSISDVLSPPALAVPGLLLGVWASSTPGTYRFALMYFAAAVIVPMFYMLWLLKVGLISDFHMARREERIRPFVCTLLCGVAAVALLAWYRAPGDFVAPLLTLLVETLVLFAVTLFWQISVHAATVAGLATFAVCAMGPAALPLLALVPVVAWARLYLHRHTPLQCVAGASLGCLAFVTLYAMRGWVW